VQFETIICSWKWSPFVGTGSVLKCWQILAFTSAYALNFINRRFGSLFWLPRVPIGSLFHEKLGPYWVPISKHGGPYKFGEQCTCRYLQSQKSKLAIFSPSRNKVHAYSTRKCAALQQLNTQIVSNSCHLANRDLF